MLRFFNKLQEIYQSIRTVRHYRFMYLMSFMIAFMLDVTSMSIIGNVIFTMFIGVVIELIYCYAPKRTITLFNYQFNVMDIDKFTEDCKDDMIRIYNEIDGRSFSYNVYGIVSFVILKILIIIF